MENLPSPSTPSEPATKGYVDGTIGEKVYDYFSDFNIPKTIDNCYIGAGPSSKNGTAIIQNYFGYSILTVNVTNPQSGYNMILFKNDNTKVVPSFSVEGKYVHMNISGGANRGQYALIDVNSVSIPISKAGVSRHLFPLNLI